MRLVISHPNVSPQTIEYLAESSASEYVLGDIAGSPKVSRETMSTLEAKRNYLIDWGLAKSFNEPEYFDAEMGISGDSVSVAEQTVAGQVRDLQHAISNRRSGR